MSERSEFWPAARQSEQRSGADRPAQWGGLGLLGIWPCKSLTRHQGETQVANRIQAFIQDSKYNHVTKAFSSEVLK